MLKNVMKDTHTYVVVKLTERNRLKHQCTDGRIILTRGLKTQRVEMWSHITCRT
jgi:hypothetical protein